MCGTTLFKLTHLYPHLQLISKVFKEPMLAKEKKLGMAPNTVNVLFGNAEEVIAVNQVFLDDLVLKLSKWSDTQTIGDVLERMVRREE